MRVLLATLLLSGCVHVPRPSRTVLLPAPVAEKCRKLDRKLYQTGVVNYALGGFAMGMSTTLVIPQIKIYPASPEALGIFATAGVATVGALVATGLNKKYMAQYVATGCPTSF